MFRRIVEIIQTMKSNILKNGIEPQKIDILKADELYCKKNCNDELLIQLKFNYRDIAIIKLRWNDRKTFSKIGFEVGLSPERVRVLYSKMKSKIIDALTLNVDRTNKQTLITNQFKTKLVNILKQKGIYTLEDISTYTKKELLLINQIGKSTIFMIEKILLENGLEFSR